MIRNAYHQVLRRLPPKANIYVQFFKTFRRFPDLKNPKTFSEKIQVRKLNGSEFAHLIDKVAVKNFVRDRAGDRYVIPTLFSGSHLPPRSERNWPIPFVIKTNNGSGSNIFVRGNPDWDAIERKLKAFQDFDFATQGGELFYRAIAPQVLVEPLIGDGKTLPLDYKFFMFNGELEYIQVDTDREIGHKRAIFDVAWNRLPITLCFPPHPGEIEKPETLSEMIGVAQKLSKGINFVRVDLYNINGQIYFGEMTFTPGSGIEKFTPAYIDTQLGAKWR